MTLIMWNVLMVLHTLMHKDNVPPEFTIDLYKMAYVYMYVRILAFMLRSLQLSILLSLRCLRQHSLYLCIDRQTVCNPSHVHEAHLTCPQINSK